MSCILGCKHTSFFIGEDEKQVNVSVQKVKDPLVVFGQITDCADKDEPVIGALVKAFKCCDKELVGICHTYSGCNGFYMLNLKGVKHGDKIVIMATGGCHPAHICIKCPQDCDCSHKAKMSDNLSQD